MEHLTG